MNNITQPRDKAIYVRQWIGEKVQVVTTNQNNCVGILTNIVFADKQLMYIMIDDQVCLNFQHIVEIRLER
jgi:RNase P/RNase MRP subunit p29